MGDPDYGGSARFQLLRRIGAGGMGIVYEALDRERNDKVALKVLRVGGADAVLRFKNEFRQLEGIDHPNLVGINELIAEDGCWLLAMELVEGDNFLSWVRPPGDGDLAHPHDDTDMLGAGPATPGSADPVAAGGQRRVGPRVDTERLRAALAQLARGLATLHGHGMVHRDIKPSNILVTAAGRVVILDFGLVTMLGVGDGHVVGTTAYMAPEQAALVSVGPEADWYSVGVLLYEALTGRLPFTGAPMRVLEAKQRSLPPRPSAVSGDVPLDLDELCMRLLAIEPRERPGAGELLARLRAEPVGGAMPSSTSMRRPPFVGRADELATLHAAFAAACRGQPRVVVVEGTSGLGKSAVVRAFLDEITEQVPSAVVLSGRCYERESVPYKAVDGVVDALARWLAQVPPDELAPLLPEHVGMLARLFPVMVGIDPIAEAQRTAEAIDPQELRIRAFSALRELLARIGDRAPLVVAVDDLQWADADSVALLGEVLAPPCAPVLSFVATSRGPVAGLPGAETVKLGPLSRADAENLARQLLVRAVGEVRADVAAIAREAHGHPMFIDELVRHAAAEGSAPAALRLDDAITARVARLEPGAQRVLEVCALYGAPLAQEVVAKAAGCALAELGRAARLLGVANLARTSGARGTDTMEPYHDRVREAVVAGMSDAARTACHLRLARALEAGGRADPDALAVHYRGGGEPERAAEHAIAAAQHAAGAFAFDRAARFYAMALELQPEHGRAQELRVALGDALANAGRGAEAAAAYLAARPGAGGGERLDLERRAAEQYLASGRIDEGIEVAKEVLSALGLSWPATPKRAFLSMLARRARLRLRGLGFRPRDESQLSAAELTRIDVCYALASVIGTVDTMRGADFQTRHLLLALRAGEPYRIARALSVEAGFTSCGGGRAAGRLRKVVAAMHAAAEKVDHPFITGLAVAENGLTEFMLGHYRVAAEELRRAEQIFRSRCQGASYEIGFCEFLRFAALTWLGELDVLARELPAARRAAAERGDRLKQINLSSSFLVYYWLAQDDPTGARRVANQAISSWSQAGFHMQHYNNLCAQATIDLYEGDAAGCHRRMEEAWPALQDSLLLYIQQSLLEMLHLRGRAAIAAAAADPTDRGARLRRAERCARRIDGEKMAWAMPLAGLLRAGVASVRGRRDEAVAALERVLRELEAVDHHLYAAAVRWQLGRTEEAGAWMTVRGITDPGRFADLLVPGFSR